jgi:energy-coupling factor transport system substrate-specific component
MRELFTMWQNTRMIVMTAISAAAYVAVLLPFKGFVIIPGLTEVRPGAAIPVVFSFLFGPAAAWGTGFGNIMADALGGMLGPGSFFGFIGNFFYGYLPYALWRAFMGHKNPVLSGPKGWLFFGVILITSCLVIGSVIGWGADLLRLAPFGAVGPIIAVNNFIASAAISTVLLRLLYERVRVWGLLYFQILEEGSEDFSIQPPERPAPFVRKTARLGATLCFAGAIIAFFTGLIISCEALGVGYGVTAFSSEIRGTMAVAGGMAPGLLLILLGSILL